MTPLMSAATRVQYCGSAASERSSSDEDDLHLLRVRGRGIGNGACRLELDALVHEQRRVAAVVEDHVRAAVAGQSRARSVHHQYSSSVSPFQAKTGTPRGLSGVPSRPTAIAAAA